MVSGMPKEFSVDPGTSSGQPGIWKNIHNVMLSFIHQPIKHFLLL